MSSQVIERLALENAWPVVGNSAELADFLGGGGFSVLLCTEDPARYPESIDVAVVLPELVQAAPVKLRAAVCARGLERDLQQRHEFHAWPALLFFRGDQHLGTIVRMHDWCEFLERMARILPPPRSLECTDTRPSA